ncbi:microneme protein 4 [Minicystis rosea]|nr:microneme protein 4 [Minicystis rosea]
MTCPSSQVCSGGVCIASCTCQPCAAGLACNAVSGLCVHESCLGVMCATGTTCVAGACVDACEDVMCPSGQTCSDGACVKAATMPSSSSSGIFGEFGGAGGAGGAGGGSSFGGAPTVTSSCSCILAGGGSASGGLAAAGVALALAVARRRRTRFAIAVAGALATTAALTGCAKGTIAAITGTGGSPEDAGVICEKMCGAHAACAEISGVPTCRCEDGYLMSDGVTCADVDECANGLAECSPRATCTNTPGSYTCTCDPGYMGDGKTCTDVDECANGTAMCASGMVCVNIPGGYQCGCPAGFASNGATCVDINECALHTAMCDGKATCTNTAGSYACTCNPGYMGDGKTCTDVDECTNGTAACSLNAKCTNTAGSYVCTCNSGFLGDGTSCSPVAVGLPGDVSINGADASTSSTAVTLYLQEPHNLLTNPGAETGDVSGWDILQSGANGWSAGHGDPVIHLFEKFVFVTSYWLDTRSQLLDLVALGYTAAQLDAAPPITVREWYRGGGYDTADSYYLKVELRDIHGNVIDALNEGATMSTTDSTWTMAGQTFTGYGAGVRFVYFEDGGQDVEVWAGNYGASMDGASVVIGDNQMRISNDNVTWSAWQPFQPTLAWTLDPGTGNKTVYVQYKDASGQTWPPVSSTITLQ